MKGHNIVALCLGIFVAALLWQYYLWPKYQLKHETPELAAMLEETAQKELEESIDYSEPGEILFIGEPIKTLETEELIMPEEDMVFHSQANKPKGLLELDENYKKKHNPINLEKDNFVMGPENLNGDVTAEEDDSSRITMLKLPAEFLVIKDDKKYKNFLQENKGPYPKVNFKKDMFMAVLSSSQASDSFFEITNTEITETEVKVFYKVNLVFSSKKEIFKNYKVIKNTDLPVNFIQVK